MLQHIVQAVNCCSNASWQFVAMGMTTRGGGRGLDGAAFYEGSMKSQKGSVRGYDLDHEGELMQSFYGQRQRNNDHSHDTRTTVMIQGPQS
jgi:hypothetical protein